MLLKLRVHRRLAPRVGSQTRKLLRACKLTTFTGHQPSRLSNNVHRHTTLVHALTIGPSVLLLSRTFSTLSCRAHLRIARSICNVVHQRKIATLVIARSVPRDVYVKSGILVLASHPTIVGRLLPVAFSLTRHAPLTYQDYPRFNNCFGRV